MKRISRVLSVVWLSAIMLGIVITPTIAKADYTDSSIYVTDNADMISDEEEQQLEQILVSLEQQTSIEYAVVTIKSLNGDSIENVANQTFRDMGIGKADKNNGLLLLISLDDRKFRLEVGYGLEGVITDSQASKIINSMTSYFKESKYFDGIKNALSGTFETLQKSGEYDGLDINNQYNLKYNDGSLSTLEWIVIIIVVIVVLILISLAVDGISSGSGWSGGSWSGGDSSGGDSSGGSFGGGSSGGGGASGGW